MAAGSALTASAPGAPVVRASASDISTGVPWASASASGPLDANGRGYGSSATSAAVNQRPTSSSGTKPVKRTLSGAVARRRSA